MKFLRDLDINIGEEIPMSGISSSSKLIKENECFIALQGISSHGVDYIDEAISNGAACILHNKKNYSLNHQIPCFFVEDLFEKQKEILLKFYDISEDKLKFISEERYENDLYICIEASSHGLEQNRLIGIEAETRALLNIEQDHLDFHKNIKNYIASKLKILNFSSQNRIILNGDCETTSILIEEELKEYDKCIVSSTNKKADYFYSIEECNKSGSRFTLTVGKNCMDLRVSFFQIHNICNLVFAIATLNQIEKNIFLEKDFIESVSLPKGRAKMISKDSKNILIDYAHNLGGMKAMVNSVANIYDGLVIVYGCGGRRDNSERDKMMNFACTNSRLVIFTSDNSRDESYQSILDDSKKDQEYSNLIEEEDREQAIKKGIATLRENEILLILGKGHEEFQEINGTMKPFNDQRVVEKIL